VVRNTYLGHNAWVQTVMWSTTEEFLFVSGAYDNQNKLWDCRSPKAPLYDLLGHGEKVLDIDWSNPKYIVSGGVDNTALQTPRRLTVAIVVISLNYSWQITRRRRADFIFVRNSIICMFVASYRSGSVSRCSRWPLIPSELSMFGFWQPFFAFSSTVATRKRIP